MLMKRGKLFNMTRPPRDTHNEHLVDGQLIIMLMALSEYLNAPVAWLCLSGICNDEGYPSGHCG